MLCQDCPTRHQCTELCEEAEGYVNQDYIGDPKLIYVDPDVLDYITCDLELLEMADDKLLPEDWERLTEYTRNLTSRQKECFRKYYFEGLTQQQIADILGINRRTVSYHIEAARKKILPKSTIR